MNVFSQRSKNNLLGVHPDMVRLMKEAIKYCPVDFTITDGVRTTEQQRALYNQGRITPGKIVTQVDGVNKKSNHQAKEDGFGYAVDLYPYYNRTVHVNDAKNLKMIADHIKEVAKQLNITIQWGGDWRTFKDYPHFELIR